MLFLVEHLPSGPRGISSCPTCTLSSICYSMYVVSMMGMGMVHSATLGHLRGPGEGSPSRAAEGLSTLTEELSHGYHGSLFSSLPAASLDIYSQPHLFSISACSISFSIPVIVFHCKENEVQALPCGFCDPVTFFPCSLCWPPWSSSFSKFSSSFTPQGVGTSCCLHLEYSSFQSSYGSFLLLVKIEMLAAQKGLWTVSSACPHSSPSQSLICSFCATVTTVNNTCVLACLAISSNRM